jgi:uncharacterized protein
MDRREEKVKVFRKTRDLFFKEDFRSPLKETDQHGFEGLVYYPVDLSYAIVGQIEKHPLEPKPSYINLFTNKGKEKKYVRYGRFKFKLAGKDDSLQIYRPLGGGELFLPFRDRTSETETHREGRYLFIEPMAGGRALVDFNRAYNPFCEYNEKYVCPLPPKENWLDRFIRAGEKRFHR